jgi:menaquinone-dependent protoporphyrinogen oxidase
MATTTRATRRVLVAYASKYGATQGIAERIAATLAAAGLAAEARPVQAVTDLAGYDAVVLGAAVYFGAWLKEATTFVRRNQAVLAARPVWLFSSGPLGAETTDAQGQDPRETAKPKELIEFMDTIQPRDHRGFFGALDRGRLGFVDRLVASLPAFPGAAGDFRDWRDIDAWAEGIAKALMPAPVAGS